MKRLLAAVLATILALSFAACGGKNKGNTGKNPTPDPNALTEDEQLLVDLLVKVSKEFSDPSAVRLLETGDYKLYFSSEFALFNPYTGSLESMMGDLTFYGVKVVLQVENDGGETQNHLYLIRMKTAGIREAAEAKFDDPYWQNQWDKCEPNAYPRSSYSTFEEYREDSIQQFMDEYRSKYPAETKPDRSGLYIELGDNDTIEISAEDTFNVAKINKALKAYWDERLGN